jgi:hypothetical protein
MLAISEENKRYWKQLMPHFAVTVIFVIIGRSRKETLVCMHNEVKRQ